MSLYVMADLHLSLSTDKPMDIFGERWADHHNKIKQNWCLEPDDVIVIPGDISWAMDLPELEADLEFLSNLPGRKIIAKGNHDYWWTSMKKMTAFTERFGNIYVLHNNSYEFGGISICGTRGWIREPGKPEDVKVLQREKIRLEASLKTAKSRPVVFLHYPPVFAELDCPDILEVLNGYGVKQCFYGHLHGKAIGGAVNGERNGIEYSLISADFLNFTPKLVLSDAEGELTENKC